MGFPDTSITSIWYCFQTFAKSITGVIFMSFMTGVLNLHRFPESKGLASAQLKAYQNNDCNNNNDNNNNNKNFIVKTESLYQWGNWQCLLNHFIRGWSEAVCKAFQKQIGSLISTIHNIQHTYSALREHSFFRRGGSGPEESLWAWM